MKNEFTLQPILHLPHDIEQFVAGLVEVQVVPLPPKKEEVVQKLQPMGQPTEGMMVAAVSALAPGAA